MHVNLSQFSTIIINALQVNGENASTVYLHITYDPSNEAFQVFLVNGSNSYTLEGVTSVTFNNTSDNTGIDNISFIVTTLETYQALMVFGSQVYVYLMSGNGS